LNFFAISISLNLPALRQPVRAEQVPYRARRADGELPSGLIHRIAGPSMPAKIQKQNSTSGKNSGKEPVSWFGQGPEWPGLQKKETP
jgi:hypothetical protein